MDKEGTSCEDGYSSVLIVEGGEQVTWDVSGACAGSVGQSHLALQLKCINIFTNVRFLLQFNLTD